MSPNEESRETKLAESGREVGRETKTWRGENAQTQKEEDAAAAEAATCPQEEGREQQPIQLSDFVGEHGAYQLALTILLFVRYVLLGLMANSGPLFTPDVVFYCDLPLNEVMDIMPNISSLSKPQQELEIREEFKQVCQIDLHLYKTYSNDSAAGARNASNLFQNKSSATTRQCTDFSYELAPDQGKTMTSEFDLVCERDWLRSLFQSLLSAAIVIAHVICGTFSDKYGRFQAQRICLLVSLFSGLCSIFATDFWTFTLMRALCSFGDLGLVVSLTTTVVELVGNKYRGMSVALVNFGYALGVSLLPYLVAYIEDFRSVLAFTVLCHMITMPLVLATNESIRWLLTNMKFKLARKELKRVARFNRATRWWPSSDLCNGAKVEIKGQDKKPSKSQASENKHKFISEQKLAFELMFKQFAEQLESQNSYDPTNLLCEEGAPARKHYTAYDSAQQCTILVEDLAAECASERRDRAADCASSSSLSPNGSQTSQADQVSLRSESETDLRKALSLPEAATSGGNLSANASQHSLTLPSGRRYSLVRRTKAQPDCMNLVAHKLSFVGRISRLFKDKRLMVAVFTIVWTTFNSELLYTSFIIINLEVGEDLYFNYLLGGCMEALAAIFASLLLSYSPRRLSLITFWLLICLSCAGLSIAHIDSTWAVWMLASAKFSQSCLSSIAAVAAYESFPTFLRQSGSGLVFTLGTLGSVFAPLILAEFDDHAAMDRVLLTFSVSSLTAAALIYFFLSETRNCELQ